MLTRTENAGTTLEILAPYLPYNIEVAWLLNDKTGARLHLLTGLVAPSRTAYLEVYSACVEDCLPVLLPFAALDKPLEDGVIPAKYLAQLLWNDWAGEQCYEVVPGGIAGSFIVRAYQPGDAMQEEVAAGTCTLLPDWNFLLLLPNGDVIHLENVIEAYTWLRSKHFAVGLEASQFIEKPASAPTIEKGTAQS